MSSFIDLQKAFGNVSHEILLAKINHYGLGSRVQQITYASTYVCLVKQVVHTIFFRHILTYVKESSIAYTRSIMTKYL